MEFTDAIFLQEKRGIFLSKTIFSREKSNIVIIISPTDV